MNELLKGKRYFNERIGGWNTRANTSMAHMFSGAAAFKFDQPLDFDTRSVTSMEFMFVEATAFNQPLHFDTRSVT